VLHTGETPSRVKIPDYAHILPKEIQLPPPILFKYFT